MKWLKAAADEILDGARKAIDELDLEQVEKMIQMILNAQSKKIFVVGMGRSGFVGRAFALRLMNLGFNVYFLMAFKSSSKTSFSGSNALARCR